MMQSRYIYIKGFTLIELLVVVAIVGILSSVTLVSVNTARKKGADAGIKQNMTSALRIAALYYENNVNGYNSICSNVAGSIRPSLGTSIALIGGSTITNNVASLTLKRGACQSNPSVFVAKIPVNEKGPSGEDLYFCIDSDNKALLTSEPTVWESGGGGGYYFMCL